MTYSHSSSDDHRHPMPRRSYHQRSNWTWHSTNSKQQCTPMCPRCNRCHTTTNRSRNRATRRTAIQNRSHHSPRPGLSLGHRTPAQENPSRLAHGPAPPPDRSTRRSQKTHSLLREQDMLHPRCNSQMSPRWPKEAAGMHRKPLKQAVCVCLWWKSLYYSTKICPKQFKNIARNTARTWLLESEIPPLQKQGFCPQFSRPFSVLNNNFAVMQRLEDRSDQILANEKAQSVIDTYTWDVFCV
jgi:hypothetical protein